MASAPTTPLDVGVRPHVAELLGAAKEAVLDEMREHIGAAGFADLRPSHGCVFRFVRPGGTRLTEMADRAGLTKQAVGEVVTDLEQMGYVTRLPDPADGRAKLVLLTARGQRAQQAALEGFAMIEAGWVERFGAECVDALRELLTEIGSEAR